MIGFYGIQKLACVCYSTHGGQRTVLRSWISPSTFIWVLRILFICQSYTAFLSAATSIAPHTHFIYPGSCKSFSGRMWKDGSVVRMTWCSWKGFIWLSALTLGSSQGPLSPASEDLTPSSGLFRDHHSCAHTHTHNKNKGKENLDKNSRVIVLQVEQA